MIKKVIYCLFISTKIFSNELDLSFLIEYGVELNNIHTQQTHTFYKSSCLENFDNYKKMMGAVEQQCQSDLYSYIYPKNYGTRKKLFTYKFFEEQVKAYKSNKKIDRNSNGQKMAEFRLSLENILNSNSGNSSCQKNLSSKFKSGLLGSSCVEDSKSELDDVCNTMKSLHTCYENFSALAHSLSFKMSSDKIRDIKRDFQEKGHSPALQDAHTPNFHKGSIKK